MANIGSSEWWTSLADNVINTGLSVLRTKMTGTTATTPNQQATPTKSVASSTISKYLPWVIGAAVVAAIVLFFLKKKG